MADAGRVGAAGRIEPAREGDLSRERVESEGGIGAPKPWDGIDPRERVLATHNAGAADPLNPTAVRPGASEHVEAADDADEASKPSFFRKVLEVAEFAARFLFSWVNLFSAAMRIMKMVFDPPKDSEGWTKELTRLGIDLLGGLFPPAAALGHLTLNAWWGADDPSDAELLAGYDIYLDNLPIVGGMSRGSYTDRYGQEVDRAPSSDQDVWLASWLRSTFSEARDFIDGNSDAAEDAAVRASVRAADPGHIAAPPDQRGVVRNYATVSF